MTKVMRTALAVAGLLAFAPAALAAVTVRGTRSNGSEFNACVDGGGAVKKDAKGNQDCTPNQSAANTKVKSTKSNASERVGGGGDGKGAGAKANDPFDGIKFKR